MWQMKTGVISTMGLSTVNLIFFTCILQSVMCLQIVRTFRDIKANVNQLQNIQVHRTTGDLYVGATNTLIHLSGGLKQLEYLNIGPRIDNPNCPPPQVPCDLQKPLTNSFSRGLTINYQDDTLIACISLFHGACQIRDLKNISALHKEVLKPIVSNSPVKSSIIFTGPGFGTKDSVYVGTTYSNFGLKSYRDIVPHISERNTNTLDLTYTDDEGGTKMSLLPSKRDFAVNFVYGFTHGSFVYFIVTQEKIEEESVFESKIIRICQQDKYFNSYTEIPLSCIENEDQKFDLANGAYYDKDTGKLYVVFMSGEQDHNSPSAVCMFKMTETERLFNMTVKTCYEGKGHIGPERVHTPAPCSRSIFQYGIISTWFGMDDNFNETTAVLAVAYSSRSYVYWQIHKRSKRFPGADTINCELTGPVDYCGQTPESKNFSPIAGQIPVFQSPIMVFQNTALKSVVALTKGNNDILFLGTAYGVLKKVIVSPGNVAEVVKEIEIESGQEINSEMPFSPDKSMLYVMSKYRLTMVDTRHCKDKKTCEECTMSPDPVCGWCVMGNSCTEKDRCPRSEVYPHWLPSKKGACAKMVEVQPKILSYEHMGASNQRKEISFKLEEIMLAPGERPNLNLRCSFSEDEEMSKTRAIVDKDNGIIKCALPEPRQFPALPEGKDFTDVQVEFQIENHPIVKRSVSVYDCRRHVNCTGCTKSAFGCQWDYLSHKCSSSSAGNANGITDPMACPMIDSPSRNTDIVVHSGESKRISVRVVNLQPEQRNLQCHFQYLSKVQVADAVLSASNAVTCDSVQFSFDEVMPYVTADFRVNWGSNNYSLDNPTGIKVRIYKCPLMVTNCGQCLSLDLEYDCGWCDDECSLQKHCTGQWMDRSSSATCSNPKILRFSPSTGPINGKTNISVTGINLGINYGDIQNGVTVAGVKCHVHMEHFEPGIGFRCETDESSVTQVGTVIVKVDNKYETESDGIFAFVDPELQRIFPDKGPKSGGTIITIFGKNLNAGTQTTVTIGKSPCEVTRLNMTTLECMTSQHVDAKDELEVQVSFGGYKRLLVPKFKYEKDPIITDIEPRRSIISGGITLTVIGERLNLIQRPEIVIDIYSQTKTMACHHIHSYSEHMPKWLICRTPRLPLVGENITNTSPKEVQYGFNLDKVTTARNVSKRANIGPLMYFPDPVIQTFSGDDGEKKYENGQKLVIEGSFKIINPLMHDVRVVVGQTDCVDLAASDTTITCTPPDQPDVIDGNGNALVQIKVGNMRQEVGFLNYFENETKDKPIALGIILGVVLPIIAIIILLAICIIRRQRKNGPNKSGIPDMLKDYDGKDEEEEVGMNHVSVKADMNGQIPDSGPYISDLLARINDEAARQAISEFLIPRSKVDIEELVGTGIFGNTYQARYATATAAESTEKKSDVAVKSLIGCNTDNNTMDAFLQQCLVLKDLQHPNILPLLGLCLSDSEEPHLVMPYLERGDIKTYVRDPAKNITVIELLEMAKQISEAMTYLESIHVIHGNLAARNCLLTDDKVVRVTGFGVMSLYTMEYCKEDEDKFKVISKWLAAESLDNFQFSHKTDVWSYGIVLWELLTRGVTPYPDVESKDLKAYLEGGHRLKKPRQCPENLYVMMLQCWTDKPNDRPTFQEVNEDMKRFIPTLGQETGDSGDISDTQPLKSNIEPGGSAEYLEVVG